MGNTSSGSARRKLGDAIQTRVFQRSLPTPLTPEEQGEKAADLALQATCQQARCMEHCMTSSISSNAAAAAAGALNSACAVCAALLHASQL